MPSLEDHDLNDTAVLWPIVGYGPDAQAQVGVPREIPARWLSNRRETKDAQGNTIALEGAVVVDQDVAPGSLLWLGTLADWDGLTSGTGSLTDGEAPEICEVYKFNGTPDLKGRNFRRTVDLMRYRGQLPGGGGGAFKFLDDTPFSFLDGSVVEFLT